MSRPAGGRMLQLHVDARSSVRNVFICKINQFEVAITFGVRLDSTPPPPYSAQWQIKLGAINATALGHSW